MADTTGPPRGPVTADEGPITEPLTPDTPTPATGAELRTETEDPGIPDAGAAWWTRLDAWVGLLVVAACCAFVFVQLEPTLLFRNTTASGGDTAAHVWWPAYLRDHLLPFRLSGWSPDFYAGFPAGQFYFPIPALLIVAFDVVAPYNVAFKLGTAAGPILLPIGAFVFARGLRLPRPAPAFFAVAATAFLFFNGDPGTSEAAKAIAFNQHIAGGSLASTLAGEYSFTIALAASLAFFGTLATSLRTGRRLWLPAVLLAVTVMSHLVVAVFAATGALIIWLASRPWTSLRRAVVIGGVGALLTAVWTFPLLAVLRYTTDMRYTPITQYSDYLFPRYLFDFEAIAPWRWGATLLIAIAIVGGIVNRRASTFVVVALTASGGLLFRFWEDIQATPAWNLRFLPFWYLGVFLLMGLGAAEAVRVAARVARRAMAERTDREARAARSTRMVTLGVAAALTLVLAVGALVAIDRDKSFLPYWVRWNFRGYEDVTGDGATPAKQFDEYRALIDAADELPPGRLLWEGNSQLNVYGSPLALMLLPYWTDGRIASMEGVYYEASATTPYHFMATAALAAPGNSSGAVRGIRYRTQTDFALGVRWLQVLGVRYLAVHSDASKQLADGDDRLRLVTTSPDFDAAPPTGWSVYRVADAPLVEGLRNQPVVVDEFTAADEAACVRRLRELGLDAKHLRVHEWQDCIGVPWFDDPDALDRPLVVDGPESWQRAGTRAARSRPERALAKVTISNVERDETSISFDVSRTGVPVIVKESWFPNWKVDGADGPYRATPNFMVVVPTERRVTLHFSSTGAEWLGRAGTGAGIVAVGLMIWLPRRRRRAPEAEEGGAAQEGPDKGADTMDDSSGHDDVVGDRS